MNFIDALITVNQKEKFVGRFSKNGATLDEIIIAPSNAEEYQSFIKTYVDTLDAQQSIEPYINSDLIVLGVFDKMRIRQENVLFISEI